MKIRSGFVSNSSSSSFVVVADAKAFDETLAKMDPFVQAVVNSLKWNTSRGKIGRKPMVMFGYFSDAGGGYTFDCVEMENKGWRNPDAEQLEDSEEDYYENQSPRAAFDYFLRQLPKNSYMTGDVGDGG